MFACFDCVFAICVKDAVNVESAELMNIIVLVPSRMCYMFCAWGHSERLSVGWPPRLYHTITGSRFPYSVQVIGSRLSHGSCWVPVIVSKR